MQPFLSLQHMSLLPQVHLEETLLQVHLILHLLNNQIHDIGFPVFLPLFLLLPVLRVFYEFRKMLSIHVLSSPAQPSSVPVLLLPVLPHTPALLLHMPALLHTPALLLHIPALLHTPALLLHMPALLGLTCPYVSGVPFMTGMNRVAAEKAVLDVMAQ